LQNYSHLCSERYHDGGGDYREPEKYEFCAFSLPDGVNRSCLFRDRAVSTLLKIEIEMAAGLLGPAGSEMANHRFGLRKAGVASRCLRRAVLAGSPDVNRSSPSSTAAASSSGGRSGLACDPVAQVALQIPAVDGRSEWMVRPEQRDAAGPR
jgi:hypothetical protein